MSAAQEINQAGRHFPQYPGFEIDAPEVVAQQGYVFGIDEALLKIIGIVIACVTAVFLAIAAYFFCCSAEAQEDGEPELVISDGAINKAQGLPQGAIDATQGYSINRDMLSVTPPPMKELWEELRRSGAEDIQITEIMDHFNALIRDKGTVNVQRVQAAERALQKMIQDTDQQKDDLGNLPFLDGGMVNPEYGMALVEDRQGRLTQVNKREYWLQLNAEIRLILQNFVAEFRKPAISARNKQTALLEIARAAEECRVGLREELIRRFKMLTNRVTKLEDKFKLWIQLFKEDLILSTDTPQMHKINHARKLVGKQWGLDQDKLNLDDAHMEAGGGTSELQFIRILTEGYTPARIVHALRARMIDDGDWINVNKYFQTHIAKFETAGDDIFDFYEEVGTGKQACMIVNFKGVTRLAELLGYVTPSGRKPIRL